MKKISPHAVTERAVANVLASLRLEELTPSPAVVKGMMECAAGKTTTDRLLAEVIHHHLSIGEPGSVSGEQRTGGVAGNLKESGEVAE